MEERKNIKKQAVVFKNLKDFSIESKIYAGDSQPFISKKIRNREGQPIEGKNKKFVLKRDPYHEDGAVIEKISYDVFALLGVKTPKSYIVDAGSQERKVLASHFLNGYENLRSCIKSQDDMDEIIAKGTLHNKKIYGLAENYAIFLFCGDPDLIGEHWANMGLIEQDDYYEVVKIDPTVIFKVGRVIKIPSPLNYLTVLKGLLNIDHLECKNGLSISKTVEETKGLCSRVMIEENFQAFEKIIDQVTDENLREIVFNPLFEGENKDENNDLNLSPLKGSDGETLQKQIFDSLKQRRDVFKQVYEDFAWFKENNRENEEKYQKLLDIASERNLPVTLLAFYVGGADLVKMAIENSSEEELLTIKDDHGNNILHLAIGYDFIEIVNLIGESRLMRSFHNEQNNYKKKPSNMIADSNNEEIKQIFNSHVKRLSEDLKIFAPSDWNVENATELFRQVKSALRNIEVDRNTSEELSDLLIALRKETDKHLSKIKEKDTEILYKALSAAYGRIKNIDGNDEAYQSILGEISEKIKDTPGLRIIGYILVGILAVALLIAAAIVIAALMNPAGLVLGVSSAAILTTMSSIFAQLTAFIASVATSVSSFFATTFGLGTGASVVIAAATDTTAGIIAASTAGVAGLLGVTGVGFFAKRDIDENKSMKKVEDIMKDIDRVMKSQG